MLWQRDIATDHLPSLIEVLRLGQKTGFLTLERGQGVGFEEGTIAFVDGRIVGARVGYVHGQEALNWLSSWGSCLFAFIPTSRPQALPPSPSAHAGERTVAPAFSLPHPAREEHDHAATDSAVEREAAGCSTFYHLVPRYRASLGDSLSLLDTLRLTRLHKRVFLLIDGHHTLTDIARLTRHELRVIYQVLRDLEKAGVIHLYKG